MHQRPIRPIIKARRELDKVRAAVNRMRTARSFDAYEEAWIECLGALERTWYKTLSHLKKTKPGYRNWAELETTEKLRETDPLLSYLSYARGAAEHSVEDITVGEQSIGINPAHGNVLYIKKMSMIGGKIFIDSPQPLKVKVTYKVRLLPIRSRERTYDPPTLHLNAALASTDPAYLGERGIEFYQSFIDKAEKFLTE